MDAVKCIVAFDLRINKESVMKNINLAILLSLVGAVFFSACCFMAPLPPPLPALPFTVEFLVAGPNLLIFTDNQGCSKNNKGCMRIPTGNSGDITFKIKSTQNYPCADNPNSHYLAKIELSNFPKEFGGEVTDWIRDDFNANKDTGLVWTHTPGAPVSSVQFVDKNNHAGVAYYRVTIESCADGTPRSTDPRFENMG
jgi:hypothetical protein